jgi:hypothetical protein
MTSFVLVFGHTSDLILHHFSGKRLADARFFARLQTYVKYRAKVLRLPHSINGDVIIGEVGGEGGFFKLIYWSSFTEILFKLKTFAASGFPRLSSHANITVFCSAHSEGRPRKLVLPKLRDFFA